MPRRCLQGRVGNPPLQLGHGKLVEERELRRSSGAARARRLFNECGEAGERALGNIKRQRLAEIGLGSLRRENRSACRYGRVPAQRASPDVATDQSNRPSPPKGIAPDRTCSLTGLLLVATSDQRVTTAATDCLSSFTDPMRPPQTAWLRGIRASGRS
jgi:hypothetical protein